MKTKPRQPCDGINKVKSLNRGASAFTEAWNYDGTGNWASYNRNGSVENRTHNAANEIQSTVSHDRNGNMTVLPSMTGKYDAWNRLVEVLDTSNSPLATFSYNGLNHRVRKTVGGTVTTSFFNVKWQELEAVASGQTTVFVWGNRYIDDLVLREKGAERLYSLADPNWNVVALVNALGTVVERMRYDAFGKVTWLDAAFAAKANSDYGWERAFTGQVFDGETGMMLYRNRFYHTGLGRFVTRDPIGYDAGDVSLYRYVRNGTVNKVDTYGFQMGRHGPIVPTDPTNRIPPLPPPANEPPTPEGDPCRPPPDPSPCWTPPRTFDREFSYDCRELKKTGNRLQDAVSKLGAEHCYVRMGGLNDDGTPIRDDDNRGTTGIGTAGGPDARRGNYPNNPERGFHPTSTTSLNVRPGATLGHGSGAGKPASEATDCEIWDCIKNYPQRCNFNANPLTGAMLPDMPFYVCWNWAQEAYKACGLE